MTKDATIHVNGKKYTVDREELTKVENWDGVKPLPITVQRKDTEQGTRKVYVPSGATVETYEPDATEGLPQVPEDRKPRIATVQ